MINGGRLEIIKDKKMQMHALSTFDVEWLIEQAERVQVLENEKTKALKRAKDFEKECRKSIVRLENCENNYKLLHENNVRLCEALQSACNSLGADIEDYYEA